jgi:hypothetical protein
VREFLGGLFGGDGTAPNHHTAEDIALTMAKTFLESVETLLKRFEITVRCQCLPNRFLC